METTNKKIDDLIEAYLSGQLKDKEFHELTEFVTQNTENRYYFNSYKKNWSPKENVEVEHSWNQLKSKLIRNRTINKDFPKRFILPQYFYRIAAVLLLGLFFGSIISIVAIKKLDSRDNTFVFNAPKGEKSIITLPDSSKIWLNGGTNIKLSKNFGITNRNIVLNGEAYFEVSKNKILPFNVSANDINVRVVGTKFNVSAYSDQNMIETTIKEGTVQITPQNSKSFKKFQLTANQEAVYNKTTSKMLLKHAEVDVVTSWKNNVLIIENEHYSEVFRKLENWYGVKFTVEGKLGYDPNYTLTIKTESLHDILELIHFITPFKYKIEGDQVRIIFKPKKV
jgi:transmembrane sensor